jgi:hypothetical protein
VQRHGDLLLPGRDHPPMTLPTSGCSPAVTPVLAGDRTHARVELADASGRVLDPLINCVQAGRSAAAREIGIAGRGLLSQPSLRPRKQRSILSTKRLTGVGRWEYGLLRGAEPIGLLQGAEPISES